MNRNLLSLSRHRCAPGDGQRLWRICLLILLALLLASCAPRTKFTSITPVATGRHQPGQVVWHDLLTDDVGSAKKFYGQLFGWTFQERSGYTLVLNNGVPMAGIVLNPSVKEGPRRACWVTCLSVADMDDTTGRLEKNGGKVIQPPAEMADRGRYCIVSDPGGAPLVLLRSASGDPEQTKPQVSGWMWDELWTPEPESVLSFYKHLGDYSAQQVNPEGDGEPYWVLMRNKRWQAGVTKMPFENEPSQWVPVIRVLDPAAVARQVVPLGGKVLVAPDRAQNDDEAALIEDPSGGIVMVQTWQAEDLPDKEQ